MAIDIEEQSALGTSFPELFAALAAPFDRLEVKERTLPGGKRASYVTARTVMNRLDAVLGPENWEAEPSPFGNSSVKVVLTVRLPDGRVIRKVDIGGLAGMADPGEDEKSGVSDALKRAAVHLGVGRYLYEDGVPSYGVEVDDVPATNHAPRAAGNGQQQRPQQQRPQGQGQPQRQGGGNAGQTVPVEEYVPRTGKALYRWVTEVGEKYQVGMLKYLNGWGKLQEFPDRMVDWDAEQVAQAHLEGLHRCETTIDNWPGPGSGQGPDFKNDPEPLSLDKADVNFPLKRSIADNSYKLALSVYGDDANQAHCMELIELAAARLCNGEIMGSLRGCANKQMLQRVNADLRKQADELSDD